VKPGLVAVVGRLLVVRLLVDRCVLADEPARLTR
jgi:hypothetical protein